MATPIYVFAATAKFALRSIWDIGALTPLLRASAFGRGFLDLELILALFAIASIILLRVERPEARQRPVAEMLALIGALLAAAAAVLVPGLAGHAAETSPRGVSIALDWIHVASGSLWIGGLIGLIAVGIGLGAERRIPGLSVCVPRFSRVAFVSVMALIASGTTAAIIHLPTVSSLWQTSYGQALLVKIALLGGRDAVRADQHAPQHARGCRTRRRSPRKRGAQPRSCASSSSGEIVLVAAVIFAAAVLSSLPPPPKALAGDRKRDCPCRPGAVVETVEHGPYKLEFRVDPNRAAVPNSFSVSITKDGAARPRRRRDDDVHHARHGDGAARVQLPGDRARHVHAVGAGARHGRALGARLRRQAA